MTNHEKLVEAAEEAINAVHGDTSVEQRQTVESLSELVSHAENLQSIVEQEIADADEDA